MRIVLSSRELIWGGGEVFLQQIALVLSARGPDVTIRVHPSSELARRCGSVYRVGRLRPTWNALIVCNDFRSVWQSLLIDRAANRVFVIHGDWQLSPLRVALIRASRTRPYAVSSSVARTAAHFGLEGVPILPMGPEPSEVHRRPRRDALAGTTLSIGTVARDDPIKRLGLFAATVRLLGARGLLLTPEPILHEGSGPPIAHALPCDIEVMHDENERFWSSVDVFLSTSVAESLGLAHLEALQHGIPVLSTAQGGPDDFLVGALAAGRLGDGPAEIVAAEAFEALSRIHSDWDAYWREADEILDSRGPSLCAQMLTRLE